MGGYGLRRDKWAVMGWGRGEIGRWWARKGGRGEIGVDRLGRGREWAMLGSGGGG